MDIKPERKSIAIIIPSFPPHYRYLKRCIKSIIAHSENRVDIFVVFSSNDDFNTASRVIKGFYPIILPDELPRGRSVINVKKFYALGALSKSNMYDYCIVIDDETIMRRDADIYELCEEYWHKGLLYGNRYRVEWLKDIIASCAALFKEPISNEVLEMYKGLYLWFNQPAVYKTSTMKDFFSQVDIGDNMEKLTFNTFDYYVYMLFLIKNKYFNVIDMGAVADYGFCESVSAKQLVYDKEKIHSFSLLQATSLVNRVCGLDCIFIIQEDKKMMWSIKTNCANVLRTIKRAMNYKQVKEWIDRKQRNK